MIGLEAVTSEISRRLAVHPRPGYIGVDVGARMIKLAQMSGRRGHRKLSAVRVLPVPDGDSSIEVDVRIEQGAIGEALEKLIPAKFGFRGTRGVCALPTSVCEPRTLQLPNAAEEELHQMAVQEFDGLATDMAPVVDLWSQESEEGELSRCSALAVRHDVAMKCADDLLAHRIQCDFIDGLPFAMARAVSFVDPLEKESPVASVDWGYGQPLLIVSQSGQPLFMRILRGCGLSDLEESIRQKLGTDKFETARLLTACGVSTDREAHLHGVARAVREAIEPHVEKFGGQLLRTFQFLANQQQIRSPQRLWLLGGGATINGIESRLTRSVGVECRSWKLPGSGVSRRVGPVGPMSLFGVAVGLSLLSES